MRKTLRPLAAMLCLGAGAIAFASPTSALPIDHGLALDKAAPAMTQIVRFAGRHAGGRFRGAGRGFRGFGGFRSAAGFVSGFIAGAILGSAIAAPSYYGYGPDYSGYGPDYGGYGPNYGGYGPNRDGYGPASSGYGPASSEYGPQYYGAGPTYAVPVQVVPVGPAAPAGNAAATCMQRFRSYDPRSGTYLGSDGSRHPCP